MKPPMTLGLAFELAALERAVRRAVRQEKRPARRRRPEPACYADIRRIARGLLASVPNILIKDCRQADSKYSKDLYLLVLNRMVESGELVRLARGNPWHPQRFARNPLKFHEENHHVQK
jgi:hypothetical protein